MRRIWLVHALASLCIHFGYPSSSAHADTKWRLLPDHSLTLLASNAGFSVANVASASQAEASRASAAPQGSDPSGSEVIAQGNHRRGSYMMAVGLGIVAGAALHAALLGRGTCGWNTKSALITDAVIAAAGLTFTFAGWGDIHLAPPNHARYGFPEKYAAFPATALGGLVLGLGLATIPTVMSCAASGD